MLIFSPSSTAPQLEIANDRIFRMCPNDRITGRNLAEMVNTANIDSLIVIERNDGVDLAKRDFYDFNKVPIISRINYFRFNDAALMDAENDRVLSIAQEDLSTLGDGKNIGVVLLAPGAGDLISKLESYPQLLNLNWYFFKAYQPLVGDEVMRVASKVHLFYPENTLSPDQLESFKTLQTRFSAALKANDLNDLALDLYYGSYSYDTAWVIAKSVLAAKSTDPTMVMNFIPSVSEAYSGWSGLCVLDKYGDRANPYYEIKGYYVSDPNTIPPSVSTKTYGYLDYQTMEFTWTILP